MNAAKRGSELGAVFGRRLRQRAAQEDSRGQVGNAFLISADDLVIRQGDDFVAAADPPSVPLRFPEAPGCPPATGGRAYLR
jgi:hypothetical protein